ncbi:MAG: hypothetical protein NZM10_04400 [Fimbriimonadales bacterium]|nr:hypothetical protein [Fimbriimonadales bacterium]
MRQSLSVMGLAICLIGCWGIQLQPQTTECLYCRVVFVDLRNSNASSDSTVIRVLEVWKQGDKVRVEEENGYVYINDGKRAYLYNRNEGWETNSDVGVPLVMLKHSPMGLALNIFNNSPVRTSSQGKGQERRVDTIDGVKCVVEAVNFYEETGGKVFGSFTQWVPTDTLTPPVSFLRLRASIGDGLIELRVVDRKQLPAKPYELFNPAPKVPLVPVESEYELLRLMDVRE